MCINEHKGHAQHTTQQDLCKHNMQHCSCLQVQHEALFTMITNTCSNAHHDYKHYRQHCSPWLQTLQAALLTMIAKHYRQHCSPWFQTIHAVLLTLITNTTCSTVNLQIQPAAMVTMITNTASSTVHVYKHNTQHCSPWSLQALHVALLTMIFASITCSTDHRDLCKHVARLTIDLCKHLHVALLTMIHSCQP